MKAIILSAFLVVSAATFVNAQTQNNRDTSTKKAASGKKTTTKQSNTSSGNTGSGVGTNKSTTGSSGNTNTSSGTTTSGTTGSGNNTGTTGNNTGATQQGNATINEGGQMNSTARYAAMGVQMGSLHRKDMKFTMMANSSNMMELQLSQMAAQRATNQAVKDFATMMVQHHTMAGQEMKQMLSSKGALIPDSAMLPMHRMRMEMLQAAQGADFDRLYMRIMVDAHEEDVDEFEDETTDARDADIRAFATRMLPVLRQHYTHAKEVRKQL